MLKQWLTSSITTKLRLSFESLFGVRDEASRALVINIDITERKRGEESLILQKEQLRALAERLQWVREEDRKQVARDLHDQIGQILTAIKMDMTWITRHLPMSEGAVLTRLKESIVLIDDGVKVVRTICSGLRPGVRDDLGLAAAIEWQANNFAARNDVQCHVTVSPVDLHLDGDRATATFRIFQEWLTNVIRHAQTKSVRVALIQEEEIILLTVEDDRIGFGEVDTSDAHGPLGLLGMKERAQFCCGDVLIVNSPGNGTTVTVRVPVDIPRAERVETCTSWSPTTMPWCDEAWKSFWRLRTGAAASINKESAAEELAIAIRKILSGVLYASASLAEILIANLDDDAGKPLHENLLDREHEIMKLISSGVPLTEIADKLHVSVKTIRSYRSRIMKKCRWRATPIWLARPWPQPDRLISAV